MADSYDVLIIGGGLAGLSCARHLHRHGISFTLFEASDSLGGRVRTDGVDGFLLDRGFQVLLTAYPETQAQLDYEALDLQPFYAGAFVRRQGRFYRLADPLREPADLLATLAAPIGTFFDKLKILLLRFGVTTPPLRALFAREEMTTEAALRDRWRFSGGMIDAFFRPFLGGIFLEKELRTSSRMFEFVFRMFSLGRAAMPAAGMGALPAQLAAALPQARLRLNTRVASVATGEVVLEDGAKHTARAIVVAVEGPEAARLLDLPAVGSRRIACLYFAADCAPLGTNALMLNGEGAGPVNNVSVLSNVAPSYAPPGQALISASVLSDADDDDTALEASVRRQLAGWFGPQVNAWRHLRTYRIDHALPEQAPPFLSPPERPVRLRPGLYVCGDHRATASLNGALTSGRHAAEAVLKDLSKETVQG